MRILVIGMFLACLHPWQTTAANDAEPTKIENAAKLLAKAFADENREDAVTAAAEALEILDSTGKEHLNDTRFHIMRGYLLGNFLEKPEEAVKALVRAIKIDPNLAEPYFVAGETLFYDGKPEDAASFLLHATQKSPTHVRSWLLMGYAMAAIEEYGVAKTNLAKVLELEPNHAEASVKLAQIHVREGDFDKGLAIYESEIKRLPDSQDLRWDYAQILQNASRPDKAYVAFMEYQKLFPEDFQAMEKLIQLSEAMGRTEKRDAWVAKIYALFRTEKPPELLSERGFFMRDQFSVGEEKVFGMEYFDLVGENPIKYGFRYYKGTEEGERKESGRITLGSYKSANDYAQSAGVAKPDERRFHLDAYFPNGWHETLGMFNGNPGYDHVKKMVIARMKGELEPLASSGPSEEE